MMCVMLCLLCVGNLLNEKGIRYELIEQLQKAFFAVSENM